MIARWIKPTLSLAVSGLLLTTLPVFGQTVTPDRLPRTIASGSARAVVADSVGLRARKGVDLGPAPAGTQLTSVHLRFNLTDAQEAGLEALMAAQQNPSSPLFRQWITPDQYAASFGLSSADLATVTDWLQTQGLQVTEVSRSHNYVTVSGTTAQINAAFGISLHNISVDGVTHYANLTDPTLPAAIASVTRSITGLTDIHPKPHAVAHTVKPDYTSSVSGSHYFAPGDYYTVYDVNPLLNASITGTGQTIAVMGQTDISLADVAAFRSASGLPANVPTVQLASSDPGTSSSDLVEAQLDVEWSGAIAQNAKIIYVNSRDVINDSLSYAITNNIAPIISISYGDCEAGYSSSSLASYNQLFRQANVQGQTILGPGGDSGATDCDYSATYAFGGLAVDFPASSPYVTGIGGLMFNEGGGSYWNTANGTTGGSALSYIPESVWNESLTDGSSGGPGGLGAGGGGASQYFTKPAYQVGTGVNDFARDVPDISFNASDLHDGYLICSSGSCTNGYRNAAGTLNVVGGTSAPTPSFAGALALIEQKLGQTKGLGNINPYIYALAYSNYYSTVFHDTTSGNNNSPCVAASPNCPSSLSEGFSAVPGYDLATGWGSVDISNMATDLPLITPVAASAIGLNVSATNVVLSAATVQAGTAVSITVNVASATQGSSGVPTGTLQLLLDNAPVGSSVTLVSGAATLSLATTSIVSGTHTVTVAYSGDSSYAGSKGSASLNVLSATAPDFAIGLSQSAATANPGGAAPGITITITPYNGFTGTVTLAANAGSQGLYFTPVFNPTTVTITGTASGTSVLTLEAYAAALRAIPQLKPTPNPTSPWEYAGSGVTVAGLLLLTLPKRNRRVTLFAAALLSTGLLTVVGCSQGSTILSSGGSSTGTGTGTTSTGNAAAGQYGVTISATATTTAGTVTHNSFVIFTVN